MVRGCAVTADEELIEQLRQAASGQYDVRSILGRGGMGAVLLADDKKLRREVAIKVLPPELAKDGDLVQRFEQEARTAAGLDHPGIIPIYGVEHSGDLHYFVMRYVKGKALDDVLLGGPLPVAEVQRILFEAAAALAHAHRRGVVHRDIKPANIMLDEAGRVMLTDFGISKVAKASSPSPLTATGKLLGTPLYMSPEQCRGEPVDGRSDEYSLGAVGYHLLTGQVPFDDESIHTVIYKHISEPPPHVRTIRPEVPDFLDAALFRAMAKKPGERFLTMEAFAVAVFPERAVTTPAGDLVVEPTVRFSAATARIDSPYPPTTPIPRFSRVYLKHLARQPRIIAASVVVVGLAVTMMALGSRKPEAPPAAAPETPSTQPQPLPPDPGGRAAAGTGFLNVNATPYGTVFVSGVELGDTPRRIELKAGRYVVEIRRAGYKTIADTVTISSGNETRKQRVLVPER
jgi:serine/threonine protein kinase